MRHRAVLHGAAGLVTLIILLPLVAPGYVLSYDMNFVPWQPLSAHLLAPLDAVPRAVPLDFAVSTLNQVMPGWLLQRLLLGGICYLAALGAGLLAPTERTATRLVALVGYAWTPFLAERLLIGQWGLLLAYAALPWLVRTAVGVRDGRPGAMPRLLLAAAVSALTPTGGLIAAATCLLMLAGMAWRRFAAVTGALVLVNLPWLLAGLLTTAATRSDPQAVAAFAARGENWAGPLVALLGTGGIWNSEVTPDSRSGSLIPLVTLVTLVLAAVGWKTLRHRLGPVAVGLAAAGAAGLLLAAAGTVPAGAAALRLLVAEVPGGGLLRDGQKFLIPYTLVLVLALAIGVERLAQRLSAEPRAVLTAGAALLPVAAMADLALGGAGALRPVRYPPDWDRVAAIVDGSGQRLLSLPLSEYRTYGWNRHRTVLDPALRYFDTTVMLDDTLIVGDITVAGENPQTAELRERLRHGAAATGAGWILVQHPAGALDAALPPDQRAGLEQVYAGAELTLYRNRSAVAATAADPLRVFAVLAAQALLALAIAVCGLLTLRSRRARKPDPDDHSRRGYQVVTSARQSSVKGEAAWVVRD